MADLPSTIRAFPLAPVGLVKALCAQSQESPLGAQTSSTSESSRLKIGSSRTGTYRQQ